MVFSVCPSSDFERGRGLKNNLQKDLEEVMHPAPKKIAKDASRGDMSDTLSEAAFTYQKRVKAGKLATKSIAPHFATDSRNFDNRGLQKPLEKRSTPRRDRSPTRGGANSPPIISKTNSGRERTGSTVRESRDRVSSVSSKCERPPTHPPSNRPALKNSPSRSKVSPDRPSTPSIEHNVDRLLTHVKLMKESLRNFLDVDVELAGAIEHQDPSDDPVIYEALWVVKRAVEELAVAKARLHTLEALLRDGKAMQSELTSEVGELCVARSERDATIADLKKHTSQETQQLIDTAVADAISSERKAASIALEGSLKNAAIGSEKALQDALAKEREDVEKRNNAHNTSIKSSKETTAANVKQEAEKAHSLSEKTNKLVKDKAVKKALNEEREAMVMWIAAAVEAERMRAAQEVSAAHTKVSVAEEATKTAIDRANGAEDAVKVAIDRAEALTKSTCSKQRTDGETTREELEAAQQEAKAEMDRLSQETLSVRASRDMSEDMASICDLRKSMATRQTQIDLLAPTAKSPPPPPHTPDGGRRDSESSTSSSSSKKQETEKSPHKPRRTRNSMSPTHTPTSRSKSPKASDRLSRRKTLVKEEKPFDLSEELSNIIGQEKLKSQLLAFEKGIELQARRKELGIECSEQQPPHMMFCGSK